MAAQASGIASQAPCSAWLDGTAFGTGPQEERESWGENHWKEEALHAGPILLARDQLQT